MNDSPLALQREASVWRLRMKRPEQGNALSRDMAAAIESALIDAEAARVRALVFEGEGNHFCTGFDLSGLEHESDDSLFARFVRVELLLQRLARAPFVTVAVAHGRAMGAGADLFAVCRVRLVREEAVFSFPGARGFGLVLGTRRLAACVGASRAVDWVEHGHVIDSADAAQAGLVQSIHATHTDIEQAIASQVELEAGLGTALRGAAEPLADLHDMADLAHLVRSASRPGLHDRVVAYVERLSQTRRR